METKPIAGHEYCIDGTHESDGFSFQGDGTLPPFALFDITAQANVRWDFQSREDARAWAVEQGYPIMED